MTSRPATVEASLRLSSEQRYAICVGNFYADLAERLVKGATDVFAEAGIGSGDIDIFEVPGAFELPLAAHSCATAGRSGAGPHRRRKAGLGRECGGRRAAHEPAPGDAEQLGIRSESGSAILLRPMARVCHTCGKGPSFGNSRSHSMVATKRRFDANLQKVRIVEGGARKRVNVCTRCLKANKVTKAA